MMKISSADVINLTGLKSYGYHGLLPEEKQMGQVFVVDVSLVLNVSFASLQDCIEQTVDYAEVAEIIVTHVTGEPCSLIETLAQRIAVDLLNYKRLASVVVTVHKPQAPLLVLFDDVSVTVELHRD